MRACVWDRHRNRDSRHRNRDRQTQPAARTHRQNRDDAISHHHNFLFDPPNPLRLPCGTSHTHTHTHLSIGAAHTDTHVRPHTHAPQNPPTHIHTHAHTQPTLTPRASTPPIRLHLPHRMCSLKTCSPRTHLLTAIVDVTAAPNLSTVQVTY